MEYSEFIEGIRDDVDQLGAMDIDTPRDRALEAAAAARDALADAGPPKRGGHAERLLASALGMGLREFRRLEPEALQYGLDVLVHSTESRGLDWESVLFGLAMQETSQANRERRQREFKTLVSKTLERVAREHSKCVVASNKMVELGATSRRFDYAVSFSGKVRVAVDVGFVSWSGGRQKSDLEYMPELQELLAARDTLLLAVVDGPALRRMQGTVQLLLSRLQYLANASTVADVAARAFADASRIRSGDLSRDAAKRDDYLTRVTTGLLRAGQPATSGTLSISSDDSRAFTARYAAAHPEYDLASVDDGVQPAAVSVLALVKRVAAQGSIGREAAVEIAQSIAGRLGRKAVDITASSRLLSFGLQLDEPRLRLPDQLPILIRLNGADEAELLADADVLLGGGALASRVGVLLDLISARSTLGGMDRKRHSLFSRLAVVDSTALQDIMLRKDDAAREALLDKLLSQVDLRVVSPFVADGPTPQPMFFGREKELRRVAEGIGRQSFALVGGRKVGKTSLLRLLEARLSDQWPVTYVDCQAHGSREDFVRYLADRADIGPVPGVESVESVFRAFLAAKTGSKQGVLLMDEVDQLFWEDATARSHPHVVSAALRSLSQLREVSVVVTGERQLFDLTRSAQSPHWNFCTPLRIGALDHSAARELLVVPLQRLRIQVEQDATELALDRTACHPNLLQYLGDQIVAALSERRNRVGRLHVDRALVDALTLAPSYRDRFTTTFWSRATSLEKLISVDAREAHTGPDFLERMNELGLYVRLAEVESAIGYLHLYGVLQESAGGWSWASDAFQLYLGALNNPVVTDQWAREILDASD